MSIQHKAHTLVIHCIDFRFQQQIEDNLKVRNLNGQFDRISWPGVSKDFASIAKSAEVSINLHDPDEAIIYEHEDCGAYGEDNSQETHQTNAQNLANRLVEIKPGLKVEMLITAFDGIKPI